MQEMSRMQKIIALPITIVFFLGVSYAALAAPGKGRGDYLTVAFLDIGQGDSIYIRTPHGADMLIDGGVDNSVLTKLREVMSRGDRDIDIVIGTHPDKDHVYGLNSVFDMYDVHAFMTPAVEADTTLDEDLVAKAHTEGLQILVPARGTRITLDPVSGVYLDILFPDDETSRWPETNEASIIARLVYGDTSFMLTGDAPIAAEQFLVKEYGIALDSDVLKLGHHGSKTSSAPLFLRAVSPDYAIVSAGRGNTYGHPHDAVIDRVSALGSQILQTMNEGTIVFESDGKSVWKK